jgi:hypothetical protein
VRPYASESRAAFEERHVDDHLRIHVRQFDPLPSFQGDFQVVVEAAECDAIRSHDGLFTNSSRIRSETEVI